MLWDVPNDPRGELRWCLSKLRGLLDDADRRRVITADQDLVALDLSDCRVYALEIDRAAEAGIADLDLARLSQLADLFRGDLLDGVDVDGNPELAGWLVAQRQRYRALHVAVLRELAVRSPREGDETFRHLGAWLRLAPFDQSAHEVMLEALVARGRVRECLSLVGRRDEARRLAARIRERSPTYNVGDLVRAFHFDHDTESLLHHGAQTIGFDC